MKYLIFDIETIPQDEAKVLAMAPEFTAPGNIKDPEKIAAAIAKKKADFVAEAALNWKTSEIVLVGAGTDAGINSYLFQTEKQLVTCFFDILDKACRDGVRIGGHNVKGFDLPMLVNRARVNRVPIPDTVLTFWKGRPAWNDLIFDTLEILALGKEFSGNGVDDVARVFGLPPKLGKGADFPAMWKRNRDEAVAYNRRDVEIEIEIANICGCV